MYYICSLDMIYLLHFKFIIYSKMIVFSVMIFGFCCVIFYKSNENLPKNFYNLLQMTNEIVVSTLLKKAQILAKKSLIVFIYGLNFSFKMF